MYSQLFSKEAEQRALLQDAREEGVAIGEQKGMEAILHMAIKNGVPAFQIDAMAQQAGISKEQLAEIKRQAEKQAESNRSTPKRSRKNKDEI